MGFSRQEYWSALLCLPPEDLPDPETEPKSPASPALVADSLLLSYQGSLSWQVGTFLIATLIFVKEEVPSPAFSRSA